MKSIHTLLICATFFFVGCGGDDKSTIAELEKKLAEAEGKSSSSAEESLVTQQAATTSEETTPEKKSNPVDEFKALLEINDPKVKRLTFNESLSERKYILNTFSYDIKKLIR